MVARCLIWTNILIAGSAAGWVVVTISTLSLPFDWVLVALAFFLALAFYTRDRLDEKERTTDRITMAERTAWIEQHTMALTGVVWAGFLSAVALMLLRPATLPPLLVGLGFALSYTVRWLPWQGRRLGWKHLPGMKMPFVAILWTLTTVIAPATVYSRLWRGDTWLLAAAVCGLIMIQILLNDLRDVAGDRSGGTISLPVLLGEPAARRIGYLLALIGILLTLLVAPIPFLLTAFYSAFLIWRYRREHDAHWRGWIEAQGLVAGLLAALL